MQIVKKYLSLIKFSHTIFAMPFAMIGFFLGTGSGKIDDGQWSLSKTTGWGYDPASLNFWKMYRDVLIVKFIFVILCMVFARSAAMAFNRYLDRHFDARNPRTALREIPSGEISANRALVFTVISSLFFIVCTFFINRLCFYLSPIALFVILGYSYTKRFTALCHLVLGLGLSLAPVGAYIAVTAQFAFLPVLFSFCVFFWVSGFDIIYALQDEEFDKKNKLYSIPAVLGKKKALRVSEVLHVLSAAAIVAAGIYGAFGWLYWAGVVLFTGMLVYQHTIVKPHDLSRVNIAFMTANGIASVIFAIFVITDFFIGNQY